MWQEFARVAQALMPARRLQAEIDAADRRWGEQRGFPPAAWLAILVEEVGEVARIVTEHLSSETGRSDLPGSREELDALRTEVAQVAAVCIRWLDQLEGVGGGRERS
ncbi:MAG TPA: hypothetical protein VNO79_13990 [Actinomycetota bacterium]|nr:hypothetical protein [Actinomycetota bacterium]